MSSFDHHWKRCTDLIPLRKGGQKEVWSAIHEEHGAVVIKTGRYTSMEGLARITREVAALRDLDSIYYPRSFVFEVDAAAQAFLILEERLDAEELGTVKDRFQTDEAILGLLRLLVEALTVIWNKRIVHRDLKPANILITEGGDPRIVDLGIARFLDLDSLTKTIAAAGPRTPIYAAPEQLQNKKSMIDHRTDFFLLGILLLELLQGYHPFDPKHVGNALGIVDNLQMGIHVAPRPCDTRLEQFVTRSLQVRPIKRFRTPAELQVLLKNEV